MDEKESPQDVITSYQKRTRRTPFLIGGLAVLLVTVGVIILIVWMTGPEGPGLFSTSTPTPTTTHTPTPIPPTSTLTLTPTVTNTPEPTMTSTPSGPFEYTVQEDDNCWEIAQQFEVDIDVLLALNNFESGCPIQPGDIILIPAPGQELPTETPVPEDMPYGTKIEYIVKVGDSLDSIASKFHSTVEEILLENKIDPEDANTIFAGQKLVIPVNIATPTATIPATSTSVTSGTEAVTATP